MPHQEAYKFGAKHNGYLLPVILVRITNPATRQSQFINCLLDTGADHCLLPKSFVEGIGIDLTSGVHGQSTGLNGAVADYWTHDFDIEVMEANNPNKRAWRIKGAKIDCAENDKTPPLLGTRDFLEHLNIRFNYPTKRIVIEFP